MKKIFSILLILILFSCNNGVVDSWKIKSIKVGMSKLEIIGLMGESPREIQYDSDEERWYYLYEDGFFSRKRNMIVISIVNGKIINFYSY